MSKFLVRIVRRDQRFGAYNQDLTNAAHYVLEYENDETANVAEDVTKLVCAERVMATIYTTFQLAYVYALDENDDFKWLEPVYLLWPTHYLTYDNMPRVHGWRVSYQGPCSYSLTVKRNTDTRGPVKREFPNTISGMDLIQARHTGRDRNSIILKCDRVAVREAVPAYSQWIASIPTLVDGWHLQPDLKVRSKSTVHGNYIPGYASYPHWNYVLSQSPRTVLNRRLRWHIHELGLRLCKTQELWRETVKAFRHDSAVSWAPRFDILHDEINAVASSWVYFAQALDYTNTPAFDENDLWGVLGSNYFPNGTPRRGTLRGNSETVALAIRELKGIYELTRLNGELWPHRTGTAVPAGASAAEQIYSRNQWGKALQSLLFRCTAAVGTLELAFHLKVSPPVGKQYRLKRRQIRPPENVSAADLDTWDYNGVQAFEGCPILPDAAFDFVPATNEAIVRIPEPSTAPDGGGYTSGDETVYRTTPGPALFENQKGSWISRVKVIKRITRALMYLFPHYWSNPTPPEPKQPAYEHHEKGTKKKTARVLKAICWRVPLHKRYYIVA
jgi:hypothetical protein